MKEAVERMIRTGRGRLTSWLWKSLNLICPVIHTHSRPPHRHQIQCCSSLVILTVLDLVLITLFSSPANRSQQIRPEEELVQQLDSADVTFWSTSIALKSQTSAIHKLGVIIILSDHLDGHCEVFRVSQPLYSQHEIETGLIYFLRVLL